MFQLTEKENEVLRSQNVTAKPRGRGGRRTPPYAFTEQGVAMLSSVPRSPRAVQVNIQIMRTFVKLLCCDVRLEGSCWCLERARKISG